MAAGSEKRSPDGPHALLGWHRHPLAVLPSGSKRCRSPSHRRGKASTSSLPRLTGWRCRAGKRRGAEPRAKLRGPGIVALLAKGLLGVAAMVRLHDRAMRQRCRLPVVIRALDAKTADAGHRCPALLPTRVIAGHGTTRTTTGTG